MNQTRSRTYRTKKKATAGTQAESCRAGVSTSSASSSITHSTAVITLSTLVTLLALSVAMDSQAQTGRRGFPVRTACASISLREFADDDQANPGASLTRRIAEAAREFLGTNVQPVAFLQPLHHQVSIQDLGNNQASAAQLVDPPYLQRAERILQHQHSLSPPHQHTS